MPQPTETGDKVARIKFKDADERLTVGKNLLEKVNTARNGMREALNRLDWWMRLFESDLPAKDRPWPNCSNVNIPLIQSHVDTWHASCNDIQLTPRPYVLVRPPANEVDPRLKQAAIAVQDALYSMMEDVMDVRTVVDQWNLNSLVQPVGIVKMPWAEEFRTVKRVKEVMDPLTGLPQIDESTNQPVMKPQTEKEVKYRGPKPQTVDLHNFVIVPLTAKSIEDAQIVGDKFRVTPDQVKRRIKDKIWDKEPAKECLKQTATEAGQQDSTQNADQQNRLEGVENLVDFDELWFWELIAPYDIDGDGLMEDCVFTIEANTGNVVRATEFPFYHGRRYYIAQRPFLRPRQRFFGRALPGILEHMQVELNTIHNQRVDGTTLALKNPFKKLRGSDVDADVQGMFPGAEMLVDTMDEIQEFKLSPIIPGIDIEEQAKDWSERASPINDLAMGRQTEGQKKTLGEVQIVTAKSGLRVSDVVRRLQEGMVELAQQTLGLMYEFLEDDKLKQYGVTRDLLAIPWQLIAHGDLGTADVQRRQGVATFLYTTLMGMQGSPPNPLVVNDPMRILHLTQYLLQAYDIKDDEDFIGSEEQLQQQMRQQELVSAAQFAAQNNGQLPAGFQLEPGEEQVFQQMVMQMGQQVAQQQQQTDQQNQQQQQGNEQKMGLQREKMGMDQQNRDADRNLKREQMQQQGAGSGGR